MPKNVIVLGTQWGDEGKGKIVDLLSSKAAMVVRAQGGDNAGHTLVVGDKKIVGRLVPSGILHEGCICLIGSGVVVNPKSLFDEINQLEAAGIADAERRIRLSSSCSLLLPVHPAIDRAAERRRGVSAIGTTGRGIGPCYEDKVARRGVRVGDLYDMAHFRDKLEAVYEYHNFLLREYYHEPVLDHGEFYEYMQISRQRLLAMVADVSDIIHRGGQQGQKILFECAQGTFLDVDYGTYPYVTSSNTVAGGCTTGTGAGPRAIDYVLGITKAYITRVGSGPFPTELSDDIGRGICTRGQEFGSVTGRPRRPGWYDAVVMRRAVAINSLSGIALMKLDVLDGMDELKICVAYKDERGKRCELPPLSAFEYEHMTPVYETLPGWKESTHGVTKFQDLPANAQAYIRRIEELSGVRVAMVSTGPERYQTIMLVDPFA